MKKKTKLITIAVLSVLATFNAFYLSYDWIFTVDEASSLYFLATESTAVGWSFCDINETLSCSAVLSHPLSQIYWIPFPLIALFVYPIILLVTILGILKKYKYVFKTLALMSVGWIMFNGYFIYQETFNIWAFCPLCLICSAIILTIFGLSATEVKKECIKNKKK